MSDPRMSDGDAGGAGGEYVDTPEDTRDSPKAPPERREGHHPEDEPVPPASVAPDDAS